MLPQIRRRRPPSTSKNTIDAGISAASFLTRDVGGMQPQLQRLEVETVLAGDDDLAVEHAALGELRVFSDSTSSGK